MLRTQQVSPATQVDAAQETVDHYRYIPLIIPIWLRLRPAGALFRRDSPHADHRCFTRRSAICRWRSSQNIR
jgi:hypothetical protein